MIHTLKSLIALFIICNLAACSSRSVMPDSDEITVSRKDAAADCQQIGKITGTVMSNKGTREQALEDLKQTAANKGANYVKVQQYSAQGTAVTGIAYECP